MVEQTERPEQAEKLREINESNQRFWEDQALVSEEYREHAMTPKEALDADERVKTDAQTAGRVSRIVQRRRAPQDPGPKRNWEFGARVVGLKDVENSWPKVQKLFEAEGVTKSIGTLRYHYKMHKQLLSRIHNQSPC